MCRQSFPSHVPNGSTVMFHTFLLKIYFIAEITLSQWKYATVPVVFIICFEFFKILSWFWNQIWLFSNSPPLYLFTSGFIACLYYLFLIVVHGLTGVFGDFPSVSRSNSIAKNLSFESFRFTLKINFAALLGHYTQNTRSEDPFLNQWY